MSTTATGLPAGSAQATRRADQARRVADVLRAEVVAGRFDRAVLPPEERLAVEHNVSRNAVRAALDLLRAEGLVERIPGTGTLARGSALDHGIDELRGLGETFAGRGVVRNEVLLAAPTTAPEAVARRLEVEPGSRLVCLERRRLVEEVPVSVDLTFVVPDLGEPLLGRDLVDQDVFVLLEEIAGEPLGAADLGIQAVAADATRAALLEVPTGSPLLRVERLARLGSGRPVDLEFIQMRGDRISLRATAPRAVHACPTDHVRPPAGGTR